MCNENEQKKKESARKNTKKIILRRWIATTTTATQLKRCYYLVFVATMVEMLLTLICPTCLQLYEFTIPKIDSFASLLHCSRAKFFPIFPFEWWWFIHTYYFIFICTVWWWILYTLVYFRWCATADAATAVAALVRVKMGGCYEAAARYWTIRERKASEWVSALCFGWCRCRSSLLKFKWCVCVYPCGM